MIILGIDPSLTSTGIAILDAGQPIYMHSYGFDGHKTDSTIIRNRRIRALAPYIRDVLKPYPIDFAVIEGPSYGSRYGNPHERGGLYHAIVGNLDVRRIPVAVCAPTVRAMWATGKGNAEKPEVFAEVKTWWPVRVANHDVGDALVLAAIGALHCGDALPFEPKGRHRNALQKVEWPEVVTA